MCIGGQQSAPAPVVPKPVPLPPVAAPAAPPREPTAPRKAVEEAGVTPDVQLGTKKKSTANRSSIKTSQVGVQSPNTGSRPGGLNI